MSDWVDNYDSRLQLYHLLARHKILKGPTDNVLKWWDNLNNENTEIVPAVGSLDSHALKFGLIKVFPYHDTFKTITNHIFLKKNLSLNFDKAKIQILEALKSGNNIIVNRILNKKNNINKNNKINNNKLCFSIINKKQKTFPGEKTNLESDSKLLIKLPQKAKIKLINNGKLVFEKTVKKLEFNKLLPGKYRFEAYYENRPWIFSNPILCE